VFHLLKQRGITFLAFSNTVSQLGDRLTHMVIITLIGTMFPGRISAFSEFALTWSLPIVILSPFAGVIIDHWNKRAIMFRCHMIQTALIVITPVFVLLTKSTIPIWILVILFFSLDLFNNTSRNAAVPDIVKYEDLVPANSLVIVFARIATFAGMVGGGYLIQWVGWQLGFYIDASTHFIAGLFVLGIGASSLFVPVRKFEYSLLHELKKSFLRFIADLRELGTTLTKDRAVIFVMISVAVLPFVASISYTVLVYLVQQSFGLGTTGVGWFGGVAGVGMLAGGLLMGLLGKKVNRGHIIIGSITLMAIAFLIGPVLDTPIFLYAMAFCVGSLFSFVGIAQDTIIQEDVLKEIRGRIFATKEFIINVTVVLSVTFIGIISNWFTPYSIIFGVGIFLLCVAIIASIIFRSIPHNIRSRL
jgi:DHA3 family macrolide efflux protein-like MFS transporter